ncbi:MAG: DUF697 domain-containing protein [Desulfobacterales bacterium]|nr:DUF697 domain-containing protein [Desulfobacterales bacterium]MBF0395446.1 DUF697 domain-containing protein [Desulfobacterales bacterium]
MEKENITMTVEKEIDKTESNQIVKNHVIGAMAVGLIPLPFVDLVALTGVQINMLKKLSQIYDIPFHQDRVKNILASLIGGGVAVTFSGALSSLLKIIPVIGQTTGALAMPVIAGATTYAVGMVFIQHFESGGTFLNFNAEAVKGYYEAMFKEGQNVASNLKKGEDVK